MSVNSFRIKNWLEHQHYGDKKSVPWIKLHYQILTSEDWSLWNDDSKLLAVVCMLIASRHDGIVPNNIKHIQRLGNIDSVPNFKPLIDSGFLEPIECLDNSRQTLETVKDLESQSLSLSSSLSSSKGGVGEKLLTEQFGEIWKLWPKKVSKADAIVAYKKSIKKGNTHETIIEGVRKYVRWCEETAREQQFIPNFATWINGLRWEDELQTPTSTIQTGTKLTAYERALSAGLSGGEE